MGDSFLITAITVLAGSRILVLSRLPLVVTLGKAGTWIAGAAWFAVLTALLVTGVRYAGKSGR